MSESVVVWLLFWSLSQSGYSSIVVVKQPALVLPTREVCEQAARAVESLPSIEGELPPITAVVTGCLPESRSEGSRRTGPVIGPDAP